MVTRDKRNANMTMVVAVVGVILAILVILYVAADAMQPAGYASVNTPGYTSSKSDSAIDDGHDFSSGYDGSDGMVSSSFQTSIGSSGRSASSFSSFSSSVSSFSSFSSSVSSLSVSSVSSVMYSSSSSL